MDYDKVKKRIAISTIVQVVSQLLVGLIGVVVLRILTNRLGLRSYGVYATTITFVTAFSLLTDMGLNTIASREIAKRPEEATQLLSNNMGLRLLLCFIMIPVISVLGYLFYPHASNTLRFGILLTSFYLFFDSIIAISSSYYSSKIRNEVTALMGIVYSSTYLIFVVLAAVMGWGLFGFLTSYVFSAAIGAFVFLLLVRKRVAIRPRINLNAWRKSIGMSFAMGTISLASIIYLKADSILISIFIGTTAVGIYGVAYSLINIFATLPNFIVGGLVPSMATAKGEELNQITQKAFQVMVLFGCLLAAGGFIIKDDIVVLVSNKDFYSAADPFAILAIATAFSYAKSVFGYASIAVNKQKKILYLSLISLLLNVGINIVVIPRYGIDGAAWVTVSTEFVLALLGYGLFYKQTGIALNLKVIPRPLLAALTSFALCIPITEFISTSSALINCLTKGLTLSILYFAIVYITGALPSEIKEIIDKYTHIALSKVHSLRS